VRAARGLTCRLEKRQDTFADFLPTWPVQVLVRTVQDL
jgi:hypothetical protein